MAYSLPRDHTLSHLTAEVLREGLREGRWRIHLPGERDLAQELQVSRAILRSALRILTREGSIRKKARSKTVIIQRLVTRHKKRSTIVFLSPSSAASSLTLFHRLQQVVQRAGMFAVDRVAPMLEKPAATVFLKKLTARDDVACWTLVGTNRTVQRYFEKRKLTSLILGHRHPGVSLPSIDLDNRAIARHATGLLLGRGHRHLGLIMDDQNRAGDKATIRGFEETIAFRRNLPDADAAIGEISRSENLDRLFQSRARPTGLIVANPFSVVAVISYLYLHGIKVPGEVSIISLRDNPILKLFPISIAHYSTVSFLRQVTTALLRQGSRASLTGKQKLIEADFVAGKSLGSL
jgi:DNA-binding LacI/PurR family transcriptional regulator